MSEEQRIIYLSRYATETLSRAYSIAVAEQGHSAFSKADYISSLAHSNWPIVFRLLHLQNLQTSVPHWPVESSIADPTTDTEASPWAEFLVRDIGGPYKDGRDFLTKWGISLDEPTQTIEDLHMESLGLLQFITKWRGFKLPEDESLSIQPALDKFFLKLPGQAREGLPTNFPKKASMIWDLLLTHANENAEWTKLDKEVKWYAVLHHFFADLPQVAGKQLTCKPPGPKYDQIQLYPDLLISVPSKTDGLNVPAIIVENSAEEAGFDEHKDSFKMLAETRMATTFSLSKFKITDAFCYGIVNGGSKMSVTLNKATLDLESDSTEHEQQSGVESWRLYQSTFILPNLFEQEKEGAARKSFSIEYNKSNYKDIIAQQFKPCNKKPNAGTFNKAKKQDKKYPKHSTIMIGSEQCTVTDVVSNKALILEQCNRKKSYFAKIFRVPEDGTLPFEYQLLLSLDHPNILKPLNWIKGRSDSEYLMIMPLKSLAHAGLRRSAFDNTTTVYGVLEALCYLHGRGIVHADVKSDNVVVELKSNDWDSTGTYGFKPYLIDFDSSFYADDSPSSARGTKVYIAPEVWEGCLTPAMDMWSWGVFVFSIFFGLNDAARTPDLRSAIAEQQKRLPSYPIVELLFDLIWKCLELDPAKRITAEQAKDHNFFYAMKHIKPSIITLYILGCHLDLDNDCCVELSEEETRIHLPPTTNAMSHQS